jgi:tRNA-uridine 2-sulfurtransferase
MKNDAPHRILVGLSGGVDSSVSAALLKEQGHRVEGAFIVPYAPEWLPCSWREERLDAMRVAAQLDIPFHTIDLSEEYKTAVMEYMISEYRAGRTPNPDIMCNKHVKFGAFFNAAMNMGFDAVATGHYARVVSGEGGVELHTGADTAKDQSYFLWGVAQEALARTHFPVGEYQKQDVRAIAQTHNLHTATKKDSQGVCFLGKIDMKEFLSHYIENTPGDVLDTQGNVIGKHDGVFFVTLGQRHGFHVPQTSPISEALYVVAKDVAHNTLTVAPRSDAEESSAQRITIAQTNWIGTPPQQGTQYTARFRYRQTPFPATVTALSSNGQQRVVCATPQPYVARGQSLVLYHNTRCIGGGIIEAVS